MDLVCVRVCSAITGEELLSSREFERGNLLQDVSVALNSRPYLAVKLFHIGAPVGKGFQASPGGDLELTAVFVETLTAEDRDHYLARLHDFRSFPEPARDHPQIVLAALRRHPGVFGLVSETAKDDKEVVALAVQWDGGNLEFVGKGCKRDRDIVRTAVRSSPNSLQYASASLKHDREIVLEATLRKPAALRHAGRGLVLELVEEDCCMFQYAGKEFQRDKEIVLAAVNQDSSCLRFVDDHIATELRHELGFCLEEILLKDLCLH